MKIVINNLTKYYNDHLILDIKNLEIQENKCYCIRGRNGTGKTTLMQIIASILPFNSGEILYNGDYIHKDILKDMTYVPQNPYIFNTTVYENIVYPLKLRHIDPLTIENEIKHYLDYFELESIKNQNAKDCSSGEKVKIALARSLIFKPKLLLLDEPTTNLDIESIEKLKIKLLEIKKTTTIIFISHDINFIKSISDVELFLKNTALEIKEEV